MSKQIPQQLIEQLERSKLQDPTVIAVNERKGRWCLKAFDDTGKACFVKWNDPENRKHYDCFLRERAIYLVLKNSGCAPEAADSAAELLVTELFGETKTLRDVILQETDADTCRSKILTSLRTYRDFLDVLEKRRKDLERMCVSSDLTEQYEKHLRQLYISGPAGTKIRRIERKRNSYLLRLAKRRNIFRKDSSSCLIHGDLHLNNFMVSYENGSERMVMIDFEDITIGSAEVELAYLMSQIEALMRQDQRGMTAVRTAFYELYEGRLDLGLYENVLENYRAAIAWNRRFHRGEAAFPLRERLRKHSK